MLSKEDIRDSITRAIGSLGCQLYDMRVAGRYNLKTVSRITGLTIEEIDRIENWNADVLNLENVIRLAAFYDKRLVVDFVRFGDDCC